MGMGHQVVQGAIFQQQFGGGFGAHFLYTGHVVHGIAHQNLVVEHQAGRYAKLFLHTRQVAAFAVHGVDDGDVFIDQLRQVFVATGHNDFNALGGTHGSQGANHVIGFHAGHIQYFPSH